MAPGPLQAAACVWASFPKAPLSAQLDINSFGRMLVTDLFAMLALLQGALSGIIPPSLLQSVSLLVCAVSTSLADLTSLGFASTHPCSARASAAPCIELRSACLPALLMRSQLRRGADNSDDPRVFLIASLRTSLFCSRVSDYRCGQMEARETT